VISVDQYQDLRARAYPSETPAQPSAIDATLTRVDYDLKISNEAATGQASLTVDVLKDGWVRVPVPAGLLVLGVEKNGAADHASLRPGDTLLIRYEQLHSALDSGREILKLHFLRGDGRQVREAAVRLAAQVGAAA